MQLDEVVSRIRGGETPRSLESNDLEFKQEGESLKRTLEIVADAVVCFANAGGGQVVVGIADRQQGENAFVGVGDSLTEHVLTRGIFDRTSPPLSVPVESVVVGAVRLMNVTVPRGAVLYSNARGTATRRVGAECRPFTPEQQRQALASRGLYDWTAAPSPALASDVDHAEVERVRRLLVAAGRLDLARLETHSLLLDLRLVVDQMLTWTGLLLLGTASSLATHAPQHGYIYQYRPSPGSESTSRIRSQRPLLASIEQALDAIESRRRVHALNLAGGVQLQLHDYPLPAVRELVVNAFVHRDYEVVGSIDIEHSTDALTISSPGGLVYGVTVENILTHPSTPRNRLLLETVTTLQIAERAGQGVDRVYREMLRAGKQPPEYLDDETRTTAALRGGAGNDAFVRFITSELSQDLATDVDVLLALGRLRDKRSINAAELASAIQRSTAHAQRVLLTMTEQGIVQPSSRTVRRASPRYVLSSWALTALGRSVAYHRATGDDRDDRDDKISDHLDEYGYITNQSLRRMFDLTMYQSRDLLRDLQNRDVLVKLDDRSGGRGVRYGPGPAHKRPGR